MIVGLIAAGADFELADEVESGLRVLGDDVRRWVPGEISPEVVVVVVSVSSARDDDWVAAVAGAKELHVVPVGSHGVDRLLLPKHLNELNWVFVDDDPEMLVPRTYAAVHTNLGRYRDSRNVRAQAARWLDADRSADFLLDDVRDARRQSFIAQSSVQSAADALPSFAMEFLVASLRHAKRLRRARIWSVGWRVLALAGVAVAVVIAVFAIGELRTASRNSVVLLATGALNDGRPDITAIKTLALVARTEQVLPTDMRYRLVADSLSRHWAKGVLGATYRMGMNELEVLADAPTVRGVDAFGHLAQWNLDTGDTTWIRSISDDPLYYFATTPTGDIALAADSSVLRAIDTDSWAIEDDKVEGGIEAVELSDDGAVALVAGPSGKLWSYDLGAARLSKAKLVGEWDAILAMESGPDTVFALVVSDDRLQLVDQSGAILSESVIGDPVESAAMGPRAEFIALVLDGRLWTAGRELALTSTGVLLPGIPTSLAVTQDELVIVGDRSAGTRLVDPASGLVLGELCEVSGAAWDLVVAENQNDVLCWATSMWVHDSIDELRPIAKAAEVPTPILEVASTEGTIVALAVRGELLVITPNGHRPYAVDGLGILATELDVNNSVDVVDVLPGYVLGATDVPITVAVNDSGTTGAVGFRDGVVVEFDVLASGSSVLVSHYTLPSHAPVRSVSWSAAGELLATDESGMVWTRPSCAGCFARGIAIEKIQARLWPCYLSTSLQELGDEVRDLFAFRTCSLPPEVTKP